MKKCLTIDDDKKELIDFLLNDWKTNKNYTGMPMNK